MRGYRLPNVAIMANERVQADPFNALFEGGLEAAVPLDSFLRDFGSDLSHAVEIHHRLYVLIERGDLDMLTQVLTRDLALERPQLCLTVYLDSGLTLLGAAARAGHSGIVEELVSRITVFLGVNARHQDLSDPDGTAFQPTALYLVSGRCPPPFQCSLSTHIHLSSVPCLPCPPTTHQNTTHP